MAVDVHPDLEDRRAAMKGLQDARRDPRKETTDVHRDRDRDPDASLVTKRRDRSIEAVATIMGIHRRNNIE
jgi:hypothetical protein